MIFFSRKFDLWTDLTRSNVDLGLKTICAIARSRRDASTVFPRSSTTIRGRSPRGSYPFPLAKVAKYGKRARVKTTSLHLPQYKISNRCINFWSQKAKFLSTTLRLMVTACNQMRFLGVLSHVPKNQWPIGFLWTFCIRNIVVFCLWTLLCSFFLYSLRNTNAQFSPVIITLAIAMPLAPLQPPKVSPIPYHKHLSRKLSGTEMTSPVQ